MARLNRGRCQRRGLGAKQDRINKIIERAEEKKEAKVEKTKQV